MLYNSNNISEKDFGVVVNHKLNINVVAILGSISISIIAKECEIIVPLHSALVRLHCGQFWESNFKGGKKLKEIWRAMEMIEKEKRFRDLDSGVKNI